MVVQSWDLSCVVSLVSKGNILFSEACTWEVGDSGQKYAEFLMDTWYAEWWIASLAKTRYLTKAGYSQGYRGSGVSNPVISIWSHKAFGEVAKYMATPVLSWSTLSTNRGAVCRLWWGPMRRGISWLCPRRRLTRPQSWSGSANSSLFLA